MSSPKSLRIRLHSPLVKEEGLHCGISKAPLPHPSTPQKPPESSYPDRPKTTGAYFIVYRRQSQVCLWVEIFRGFCSFFHWHKRAFCKTGLPDLFNASVRVSSNLAREVRERRGKRGFWLLRCVTVKSSGRKDDDEKKEEGAESSSNIIPLLHSTVVLHLSIYGASLLSPLQKRVATAQQGESHKRMAAKDDDSKR